MAGGSLLVLGPAFAKIRLQSDDGVLQSTISHYSAGMKHHSATAAELLNMAKQTVLQRLVHAFACTVGPGLPAHRRLGSRDLGKGRVQQTQTMVAVAITAHAEMNHSLV